MDRIGWLALVLATYGVAGFLLKVVGVRLDNASGVLGIVIGYAITGVLLGIAGGGKVGASWPYVAAAAIGALYILGNWAFLRLAQTDDISTLSPFASMSVAVPIILGFVLLSEPVTLKKLAGIACAIAALLLLS